MTAEEFRQVITFDDSLAHGVPVVAHWTSSNRAYAVPATVIKVNAKSLLVTLDEEVRGSWGGQEHMLLYPQGHTIKLPRITDVKGWTANNCAQPRP